MVGGPIQIEEIKQCEAPTCRNKPTHIVRYWNGQQLLCEKHLKVAKEYGQSARDYLK